MNDEQLFLANAYLDGELTADERAIAEADPAVMAEVEQLRVVQARMRAVEPPSAAARERAIAAAMAEFAAGTAVAAAPAGVPAAVGASRPARTPFWARPAQRRFVSIAAAIVAVGALGMIVSQFGEGGGDDDSAEPAAEDLAGEAESAAASAQAEIAGDGDASAEEATAESADSAAADMMTEAVEESGSEEMARVDVAEATGEESTEATEESAEEAPPFAPALPDFDPAAPVSSPLELGAFGRYLLDEQAADRLGPTPNTACPAEFNILGETTLVDDANSIDDSVDVYVGVLEADRTVLAIDRDACDVLASTPLTEPTEP